MDELGGTGGMQLGGEHAVTIVCVHRVGYDYFIVITIWFFIVDYDCYHSFLHSVTSSCCVLVFEISTLNLLPQTSPYIELTSSEVLGFSLPPSPPR